MVPDAQGDDPASDPRTAALAGNLAQVRARIDAACRESSRDPAEITLIAVAKTFPVEDVVRLAQLGVTDIGENRDQEAAPKSAALAQQAVAVRWHFVGQLQRNKARSVAGYADLVHSVDSVRLAAALATAAQLREQPLSVLIQVSIDGDPSRGGATEQETARLAEAIAASDALRLGGVMTVAPMSWQPAAAYAALAEIAARLRADHPAADIISAGMSADLEAAVRYGATHLRIGSVLLGNRPPLR